MYKKHLRCYKKWCMTYLLIINGNFFLNRCFRAVTAVLVRQCAFKIKRVNLTRSELPNLCAMSSYIARAHSLSHWLRLSAIFNLLKHLLNEKIQYTWAASTNHLWFCYLSLVSEETEKKQASSLPKVCQIFSVAPCHKCCVLAAIFFFVKRS